MIGFVQENDLNQLDKAKATYESFLAKYPNDPDFTDDAQNALKLLGKSPEEIIKEFEKAGEQAQ
jgi:TolA-binding protein